KKSSQNSKSKCWQVLSITTGLLIGRTLCCGSTQPLLAPGREIYRLSSAGCQSLLSKKTRRGVLYPFQLYNPLKNKEVEKLTLQIGSLLHGFMARWHIFAALLAQRPRICWGRHAAGFQGGRRYDEGRNKYRRQKNEALKVRASSLAEY
ncbi:hypothetical protein, partial [Pseudomonas sp.]|uniref:hypothetical protein n=1 Tax=Pseudomonas sp. TaxID=306 RepID=UPI0025865C5D